MYFFFVWFINDELERIQPTYNFINTENYVTKLQSNRPENVLT